MMDGSYTPFYGSSVRQVGEVKACQASGNSLASTHTMIELLQRADAVVVSDQARARQLIDRVMDILHATLTEHENATSARADRPALWQKRRLKTHIETREAFSSVGTTTTTEENRNEMSSCSL
jgi:hypothetical protein